MVAFAFLLTLLAPGVYHTHTGSKVYVGVEHFPPDPRSNQTFDPKTQRITDGAPRGLTLVAGVHEERRTVRAPEGALGVSLWYAAAGQRPTVILIHGNDAETREMGFLIPYFAANGMNVISYDQRGTGNSAGSWFLNGPADRARDVDAVFDAFERDPHVSAKQMGVWGVSNGGWTAPIVATQRPLAFMILKSAPAESLEENIFFESREEMLQHGYGAAAIAGALQTWKTLIAALQGRASWSDARAAYDRASRQPWFGASLIPPTKFPLSPAMKAGLRRFVTYDPAPVLRRVKTPTLALFGSADGKVDVPHAMRTFKAAFREAGMTDFSMHLYPHADHLLQVSPNRYPPQYPSVMLDWLRARGFIGRERAAQSSSGISAPAAARARAR